MKNKIKFYKTKLSIILFLLFLILPSESEASTTIEAQVVRNQVGSGSTFISSGFPFPPGLVTEAMITDGTIKILVNGSEVAANVSALRGRHSDGTLRSALIQFDRSMAEGEIINAQIIIDDGVRIYADPPYQRPTLEIIQNNNVIIPVNPEYISETMITFQKLLPIGSGSTIEEKQYTTLADDRFDALVISGNTGTAEYENSRAMLTLWARSGDIKYFNHALTHTISWLDYNTPAPNLSPDCRADELVNPDGRTVSHNHCGLPAEWHFSRVLSYASMYLLTGYRDFWSIVAYNAQAQQTRITDQALADKDIIGLSQYDIPRFPYATRYGALIAASMIDATTPIDGQWFGARQFNWSDQLHWTLNAIKNNEWNFQWIPFTSTGGTVPAIGTAITQGSVSANLLGVYTLKYDPSIISAGESMPISGYLQVNNIQGGSFSSGALLGISASATGPNETDYRQGMTGSRSNSPRTSIFPSFQLIFITNFLIDYYLLVEQDERIPAMVKTNLDILLQQIEPMDSDDSYYGMSGGIWGNPIYGKSYAFENPISTSGMTPYELPEYPRFIAFVLKTSGEDIINGASYATWYNRVVDTANNSPIGVLIWQWKLFGQFYGFGADAPWIMTQSSLPTPTFREPTFYPDIPRDTPDLQRTSAVPDTTPPLAPSGLAVN